VRAAIGLKRKKRRRKRRKKKSKEKEEKKRKITRFPFTDMALIRILLSRGDRTGATSSTHLQNHSGTASIHVLYNNNPS
jgi:hypothetical protein